MCPRCKEIGWLGSGRFIAGVTEYCSCPAGVALKLRTNPEFTIRKEGENACDCEQDEICDTCRKQTEFELARLRDKNGSGYTDKSGQTIFWT